MTLPTNPDAHTYRSALTDTLREQLPQLAPGITDDAITGLNIMVRDSIREDLQGTMDAVKTSCVKRKHPGSRAETARTNAQECVKCMQLTMGIQRAMNTLRYDPEDNS